MEPRTVAVVGAGPAGSAAALAALASDPAARVLLLDRESFPRDKACGDGVAPHVLRALAGFGLANLIDDYRPTTDLELASRRVSGRREMRQPLRVVPRTVLDARLLDAAVSRGAVFERRNVRTIEVRDDAVVLDGDIVAGTVIAADGVESAVRRQLGIRPNPDGHMAVAIRGYTPTLSPWARLIAHGRDWPAYAWEFPIGDGTSNVGYGEVLRPHKTLTKEYLLQRLEDLVPGATPRAAGWRAARIPMSTWRPRQPPGRVLLAGDAASLVNPMSGEGIYYAVRSGLLAGEAATLGAGAGDAYRRALAAEFARHFRHTTTMATLGRIGGLASLGVRMTAVDEGFFHDEVEVSIAGGTYRPLVVGRALARAVAGRGGVLRDRGPKTTDVTARSRARG